MKGKPDSLDNQFWEKVQPTTGCWLWVAACVEDGYGVIRHQGKNLKAHRVSWELHNGPIPEGMCVCHHCDNPPCVRPDHLFLGTPADNNADMLRKGRGMGPRGSLSGWAKLNEEKVRQIRSLYASGEYTQKQLALMFGVVHTVISRVVRREIWVFVE